MEASGRAGVRGLFGLIGFGAGLWGGWYAHQRTASWALAAFVFVIATFAVSRGLADVITDRQKGKRAVFFGLPPALAVGVLALAQWLWDLWWLSVTLGFVGYFMGFVIAMAAFPRIAREEHQQDLQQMAGGWPGVASARPREAIGTGPAAPFPADLNKKL